MAAGKRVLVLEARDRIGGRTFTDTSLGFGFDTGAQWLPDGATAKDLAKELGGTLSPGPQAGAVVQGGKALSGDRLVQFAKSAQAMAARLKELREKVPGVDPALVLRSRDPLDLLAYFELINKPPFESEAGIAGGIEGGIGAAVARFGARVPVKLGTRVLRVDTTGREVEIETTTGIFEARAAIVALPAAVLGGGHVSFAPPLAQKKRTAIAAVGMASCMRIAVAFSQALPKGPANGWLTGITRAGLPFDALVRPDDRNAAIVILKDFAARQVEDQGPSASAAFALSTLVEVYGAALRPAYAGAVASRWGHDPFASGAWCIGVTPALAGVLASPHQERVLFAGEATEAEGAGTIAAAWARQGGPQGGRRSDRNAAMTRAAVAASDGRDPAAGGLRTRSRRSPARGSARR